MNLSDEIRKQIEKNKELKLTVGEINNHRSILEGLVRNDIEGRKNEAYQQGLNDAWEAAKKVVLNPDEDGLAVLELNEVFNCATIQQVFRRYTLSEVIAKLKAYEEKRKADNKFEFGDEIVDLRSGVRGCVISKDNDGCNTMYALFNDCRVPQYVTQSNYRKTGKHFDIDKILEEVENEES